VDSPSLQRRFSGFIRDFWDIIREYPNEKRAQLLEFVTASDRVPVNGMTVRIMEVIESGLTKSPTPFFWITNIMLDIPLTVRGWIWS
jgi:hypothetical protein